MPRGKPAPSQKPVNDPIYNNPKVGKFINYVMRRGKRSLAQKIVYQALEKAAAQLKKEPLEVFQEALSNVGPQLEVRPRRVGGATYQVPIPVRGERRDALAMRWIINAAREKKGQPMQIKLANELVAAVKNEGGAIKKKEDTRKMAEANKAFAHFKW